MNDLFAVARNGDLVSVVTTTETIASDATIENATRLISDSFAWLSEAEIQSALDNPDPVAYRSTLIELIRNQAATAADETSSLAPLVASGNSLLAAISDQLAVVNESLLLLAKRLEANRLESALDQVARNNLASVNDAGVKDFSIGDAWDWLYKNSPQAKKLATLKKELGDI